MTMYDQPSDIIDIKSLDRLVDGDLSDIERRELLLRLERDPEGWRRCALAFLEDQAWRKALAAVSPAEAKPIPASLPFPTSSNPARTGLSWIRRCAIAASLMGATFAAGFGVGGLNRAGHRGEVAIAPPAEPSPTPPSLSLAAIREVGSLELVDASAGESPPERFPIHAGPGLDDRWLRSQPPSVPGYIKASWERQGYQVAERRKVVSVEVGDGRRVAIPVDEVEVDYVGKQPL